MFPASFLSEQKNVTTKWKLQKSFVIQISFNDQALKNQTSSD